MWSVPSNTGWIEVICGSMFSGKTEELIRRVRLAQIAKQRVVLFKPAMDDRYAEAEIVSHNKRRVTALSVKNAQEILEKSRSYEVIGIDEAQFFGMPLVNVSRQLADEGKRLIICGLDQDYQGEPFEPMPQLLAIAEYITKNLAICMQCGNPANKSQRLSPEKERVVLGANEAYEARCRRCHRPHLEEKVDNSLYDLTIADA